MLAAVDPNQLPKDPVTKEPMKDAVTVVQALEAAVKVLDEGNLKDQPLVEANVRNTIGNTLRALARYDDAEPNLRKSLEIRRAALPADHPNIATGLNNLAELLRGQNKLAEAEPLFREALAISLAALPAGHPDIALGLNNLAGSCIAKTRAPRPSRSSAKRWRSARALPAGHPDIALGLNNLADLLQAQNKLAEAEPLYREALAINRRPSQPGTRTSPGASITSRSPGGPEQACRRRAARPRSAGDPPRGPRRRAPGHRHRPEQPRGAMLAAGEARPVDSVVRGVAQGC